MVSGCRSSSGHPHACSVDKASNRLYNHRNADKKNSSKSHEAENTNEVSSFHADLNNVLKPYRVKFVPFVNNTQRAYQYDGCTSTGDLQVTPKSAMKHVIKRRVFRKWVKSYHRSVRDRIASEIADAYYTKHYSESAFKAFTCSLKNKRIKEAKQVAELFAIKIVISRWHDIAVTAATERHDAISASIFYQTSLLSRALRALKMERERRVKMYDYVYLIARIIERSFLDNYITPLRNHAKKLRRIAKCSEDIRHNHEINSKMAVIDAWNFKYRYGVASKRLEPIAKFALLRQGWESFVYGNRDLSVKESLVEEAVRREKTVNALYCWNRALKHKHAGKYYDFVLMYKSFSALKRMRQPQMGMGPESSKTSISDRDDEEFTVLTNSIKAAVSQKRNVISGAGVMSKVLQQCYKRLAMKNLKENVKIVETELLKETQILARISQCTIKRTLKAWNEYVATRQTKNTMKLQADLMYRRSLLCRSFDSFRKEYLFKLESFNIALANFKARQRLLNQRRYFLAFVSGVENSHSLRVAQGVIESLHESRIRSAVMERFEVCTAKSLWRKVINIAAISNTHINCNEEATVLAAFRNVVFRNKHDDQGMFKPFVDRLLSPNVIFAVTRPLRSECVVLLYYISAMKTRALELMNEFGMRHDDIVVRVCQSLSSKELCELHSMYAYQLYKVRLEGYPTARIPSAGEQGNADILSAPNDNVTGGNDSSSDSANSQNSSHTMSECNSKSSAIKNSSAELDDLSMVYARDGLNGIPNWLAILYRRLAFIKICKVGRMTDKSTCLLDIHYTAFDLLVSGMPLWRLCYTKFLLARCKAAFRSWKTYSKLKQAKREKMLEIRINLQGLFNMSILMKYFNDWINARRIEYSRRVKESAERCGLFTSILSLLVYRSVSIVFIRLHLKCIMSIPQGTDRMQQMKKLLKSISESCRECDASAEITSFWTHSLVSKHFLNWRMQTKWNLDIKSKASKFYRLIFLKKGWDAIRVTYLERLKRRSEQESLLEICMSKLCLGHNFDVWHKATLCRESVASINPSRRVVLLGCLHYWKSHSRNHTRLGNLRITIHQSHDMTILEYGFKMLLDHFQKSSTLKVVKERFHVADINGLLRVSFARWKAVKDRNAALCVIQEKIMRSMDMMMQNHIITTMNKFSSVRQVYYRTFKHNVLGTIELSAACNKVERLLDKHLVKTQERACREFFTLHKSMKRDEIEYTKMISGNGPVYSALVALSKLKEIRTGLGIRALRANVLYTASIRKLRSLHKSNLLAALFRRWRRWTSYNVKTSNQTYIEKREDTANSDKAVMYNRDEAMVPYHSPSEDDVDRYCLVMTCFKQWKNITIMLPGRNAAELIEAFTEHNRQLDGIYALKLHALSALWNRTCETRLRLLVDSMECKLKWSIFHQWKLLARQRMVELYDENHCCP